MLWEDVDCVQQAQDKDLVACSCKHGDERFSSIKVWDFFDHLSVLLASEAQLNFMELVSLEFVITIWKSVTAANSVHDIVSISEIFFQIYCTNFSEHTLWFYYIVVYVFFYLINHYKVLQKLHL